MQIFYVEYIGGNKVAKLKVGRNVFDIDNNDLILDNGACYQIITKEIRKGFDRITPKISSKLFNDLKKCELIFTSEGLRQIAIEKYENSAVTFWKFDVDQMKKMDY